MNNDIITIFIIYYIIMIVRNINNARVSYSPYYMYNIIMLLFTRLGVAK